jgi:hypothetical protein
VIVFAAVTIGISNIDAFPVDADILDVAFMFVVGSKLRCWIPAVAGVFGVDDVRSLHCKSGSHKNGIRKSSRKTSNHIMGK